MTEKRRLLLMFLFFLLSGSVVADTIPDLDMMIQKAEDAFYQKANRKRTDFWVARYLALSKRYSAAGQGIDKIEAFQKKRKLTPKAFIPDDWHPGFIEWFETSVYDRWAVDDKKVREKHRSFEIAEAVWEDKFFAKVVASPEVEMWHLVHDGVIKRPIWMLMGSYSDKPALFFGKIIVGSRGLPQASFVILNTERRNIHYVWQPEFHDADGDGEIEVWLRYNLGWGNGFAQILEIYKIKNEIELVLFKRFKAEPEGFVRRSEDGNIEYGYACPSHDRLSRMQYDRHHVEIWQYDSGDFKHVSEKDIPFVYRSDRWKDYV